MEGETVHSVQPQALCRTQVNMCSMTTMGCTGLATAEMVSKKTFESIAQTHWQINYLNTGLN